VNRVDIFQALGGQSHGEIFFADPIDAMSGEFFSPLVDKDVVLVEVNALKDRKDFLEFLKREGKYNQLSAILLDKRIKIDTIPV